MGLAGVLLTFSLSFAPQLLMCLIKDASSPCDVVHYPDVLLFEARHLIGQLSSRDHFMESLEIVYRIKPLDHAPQF
jgi:hypothetical protein